MGKSECGSVCSTPQLPGEQILQLPPRSRSDSDRCFLTEMDNTVPLCIPTVSTSGKNTSENPSRESEKGGGDSSSLEETALVPVTTGDDSRQTSLSSTEQESAHKPNGENSSPTGSETTTSSRVVGVRSSLQEQGISEAAANIICSSWRKSTEKSYSSAWNRWSSWCDERVTDPFSATIAEIAEFLTSEFRAGKQYSTINSYRSAISNTHPQVDGNAVGKHPIICRLMQGMFNERPTEPRYTEIWDIDQVLSYLEQMEDPKDLTFKQLTLKTIMLMALANADRASDLHLLDIRYMKLQPDKVQFSVAGLSKTRRSGPPREVVYSGFADNPKLCPVKLLYAYIDKSKDKRSDKENRLFLALKKPHLSVSTSTISRWLKEMLAMAGVDSKFTAHSTRAASVSAAKTKGASVADILKAGNWSRESTFNRFYNKPTQGNGNYTNLVFSVNTNKEVSIHDNMKRRTIHCHICSLITPWN